MATDSLFDPTGPNAQRGAGNRYLGEQGVGSSTMPPNLVDGKTAEEADRAAPFTADADEAAERLKEMQKLNPTDAPPAPDDTGVPPMNPKP
ncbi:MAG TPA: hypothetical protein VK324_09090 [Tepidisphaeraceae bacterium]|nr:hypothetical protein [Tepidisphaeraceae bacterium]